MSKAPVTHPMTDDELEQAFGVRPVADDYEPASPMYRDAGVAVPEHDKHRVPVETPGPYDMLGVISTQLSALIEIQQAILAALGSSSDSRSSIELKVSSARTAPDPTVKVYAGSPVDGLVDTALAEFGRLKREAEARSLDGWSETVDALERVREGAGK